MMSGSVLPPGSPAAFALAPRPSRPAQPRAIFFQPGAARATGMRTTRPVVVASGIFGETPVAGIDYVSGSVGAVTGSDGAFEVRSGTTGRVFYRRHSPGSRAAAGKALITPAELVRRRVAPDMAAAVDIERLLPPDATPGDAAITVAASARAKAVKSDAAVATAIE